MNVQHDDAQHRFVVRVAGGEAKLVYEALPDGTLDFQHTEVPEQSEGHGVAGALATAAFDWAREAGHKVVPSCPFVRAWLARHPDRSDQVAAKHS